jgi:hypothetical protein
MKNESPFILIEKNVTLTQPIKLSFRFQAIAAQSASKDSYWEIINIMQHEPLEQ